METNTVDFYLLYGTQTDTARCAAEEAARQALRRGFKPSVMEMDEFPTLRLPQTSIVIFIVSTTGEGEAPETMRQTWKFLLRSDLPSNSLKNLAFTVFGLGDSSYTLFNAMAKKLTQRLLNLGSSLFHKVGLGDYQHDFGFEGEFDPWLQSLWPQLAQKLQKGNIMDINQNSLLPPVYTVQNIFVDSVQSSIKNLPTPHSAVSSLQLSTVKANQKLTSEEHWQDTRRIELSFGAEYDVGDIVMVHPANSDKLVKDLLEYMNLNGQATFLIKPDLSQTGQISQRSLIPFPENALSCTELFKFWLNISEPPSRFCCEVLSEFCTQQIFKDKLKHFASKTADGKSEYFSYCQREHRNILEVMKDFQVTEMPLSYFIQCVGRQRVREYSISSYKPMKTVDLTMAVTEFKTKFNRLITGVCSGWLRELDHGQIVPTWLKKGTMSFDENKPLIMVGPGTGVAAFRSVIQKFKNTKTQMILVFGCRSKKDDNYYADEWEAYQKEGCQLRVITAFSRESPDLGKTYVQHKIRENAEYLRELLLGQDANIYVSGRAKFMPTSVQKAFEEITSIEQIKQMKLKGKYQCEVW